MIRFRNIAGALLAAGLLAACGVVPVTPPSEEFATAQAGYGRAFGRIVYVEEGKEGDFTGMPGDVLVVYVRGTQDGQLQHMFIQGKGDFAWPLRPGDYVVVGYQRENSKFMHKISHSARIWSTFSVPTAGLAVYIGELRIEARNGVSAVSLADRFDETVKAQGATFKQADFEPVKGMMRPESRVESYERISDICNETAWGIKCTDEFRGLEPRSPEGTAHGYPVTQSVSPTLEWKPAAQPDVTYDVVIFESYPAAPTRPQLRGARIAYAEGLREPRFVPPQPLQAGKTYEWTVRARKGDTVSSWSARSSNLIVKASYQPSYGFSTPR